MDDKIRLIEANLTKKALKLLCEDERTNVTAITYFALMDLIDKMPTIEVESVKSANWISVKDRLPEIGKSVLIYYPKWDGDEIQVAKLEDDGMMFDICGEFNIGTGVVTHWMPLPQPPKESGAEWVDNKCSICGKGIENLIESREWYENEKPNYCPFCGTRFIMKGSDAE